MNTRNQAKQQDIIAKSQAQIMKSTTIQPTQIKRQSTLEEESPQEYEHQEQVLAF